jgi:hypothetical protein
MFPPDGDDASTARFSGDRADGTVCCVAVRGRPCCEWGGGGSVKTFSTRGVDASTARFCTKVRGACAEG